MQNLQPLKLLPAREMVASTLRRAIWFRELKEGDSITLDGIARQLGVSSTPVREAFQILASDGLIQLRPNKGAVVLGISRKTIIDHYQARAILERECAAAVCRNNADISAIVDAHEQAREALMRNDSHGYSDFNQAFHNAIWDAAGNDKIKSMLASMWNGLSMGHKITEDEYAKISNSEHQLIVEAIVARDEARAMKLMNDHIIRSMENILTRFSDD